MNQITSLNISVSGVSAGPISRIDKKIESFSRLPLGWHYGKGVPARRDTVRRAINYNRFFLSSGYPQTDAFPGIDGQIMVSTFYNGHSIEVTVEVDMSVSVAHQFEGVDKIYEPDISEAQATLEIAKIFSEIECAECDTSGSLMLKDTTIPTRADLATLRLQPQVTAQELQSLIGTAAYANQTQFAVTSLSITPALAGNLRRSGLSQNPLLRHPVVA